MSPTRPDDGNELCPSARCEEGAIILGIVGQDGVVGYISPEVEVDHDFVRRARAGRRAESRFRFSQPCITTACRQWTGSRCGVIDRALLMAADQQVIPPAGEALPRCSIRPRCRWFAQGGPDACRVCPYVITECAPGSLEGVTESHERGTIVSGRE